jgi:cystathionine gamma-synthase
MAAKQMSAHSPGTPSNLFGGMLSFESKDGYDAAMSVAAKTKIFIRATSLGGVESLIEHRASIEGPGTTSPGGLLRLSIGLENADDLIEDLDQALG